MPEGDSVARNAEQLREVLEGEEIVSVDGTAGSVRTSSPRILSHRVDGIRTKGKNLVIDFDNGWSIRVHLGMTGRWSVRPKSDEGFGPARLVLSTQNHSAALFAAPTVEVDRTPAIEAALARLGPDVLDEEFDSAEFVRRARLVEQTSPIAQVITHQRVIAGIGNVYKSEVLFLEKVHPWTPTGELSDQALVAIADRARKLMSVNVSSGARTTTVERGGDRTTWVYDRAGLACRRCSTQIESDSLGDRATYWCPGCQPGPY